MIIISDYSALPTAVLYLIIYNSMGMWWEVTHKDLLLSHLFGVNTVGFFGAQKVQENECEGILL